MEETPHQRVIGQDEATSRAIRHARVGLKNSNRPIANSTFSSPTGICTSLLVKGLAAHYFGSEDAMICLDIRDFMGRHTVYQPSTYCRSSICLRSAANLRRPTDLDSLLLPAEYSNFVCHQLYGLGLDFTKSTIQDTKKMMETAEAVLSQRNGESVLFQGRRPSSSSRLLLRGHPLPQPSQALPYQRVSIATYQIFKPVILFCPNRAFGKGQVKARASLLQLAAATVLNPDAPLFFPTATVSASGYELSATLLRSNPFSVIVPQRSDHNCISKGTIFIHPSLIYYHSPSIPFFQNFSHYIPPPEYSVSSIIAPKATELSDAFPRLGNEEPGGELEKERVPIGAKVDG